MVGSIWVAQAADVLKVVGGRLLVRVGAVGKGKAVIVPSKESLILNSHLCQWIIYAQTVQVDLMFCLLIEPLSLLLEPEVFVTGGVTLLLLPNLAQIGQVVLTLQSLAFLSQVGGVSALLMKSLHLGLICVHFGF